MATTMAEFEAEQARTTTPAQTVETPVTQDATPPITPEVTTPSSGEGEPPVTESMVIIDGKKRPLKNYEAELRRKHEEEMARVRAEYDGRLSQAAQMQQPPPQTNFLDQVYQTAEQEIATTGRAVPIQTIMQLANSIAQRNIETQYQTKEQSGIVIDEFKDRLEDEPDYKEIRKDVNSLIRRLRPEQVTPETLDVIVSSVRGRKIPELLKRERERVKSETERDAQILGAPTTGAPGVGSGKASLTAEQKTEMERMNLDNQMEWSEAEYLKSLKKKQDYFKTSGARNIPQVLSDQMIK